MSFLTSKSTITFKFSYNQNQTLFSIQSFSNHLKRNIISTTWIWTKVSLGYSNRQNIACFDSIKGIKKHSFWLIKQLGNI